MTFDDFENIVSLICIAIGLMYCIFKYIESPRRVYACLVGFFLSNFLGEYYWAIYVLTMRSDPDVSEFVSYLGWNIAIVFLVIAVILTKDKDAKHSFHPVMLLPVILNIPQFIMYISWDWKIYVSPAGILNNLWQVGVTTVTAVLCMQELVYYLKNKANGKRFPLFALIVIMLLVAKYGMWTSSCFEWSNELLSPYLYFSVLSSVISVFLSFGAERFYDETEVSGIVERDTSEQRLRVLLQTILCLVVVILSVGGFYAAAFINSSDLNDKLGANKDSYITGLLFLISVITVLLILVPMFILPSRFQRMVSKSKLLNDWSRSRINFVYTIIVTLILMAGIAIYNSVSLYNASVVSVYEDGDNVVKATATDIENYLTVAETTLRIVADSVNLMIEKGYSSEDICQYLTDQTRIQSVQFDENFTGIYAYVNGEYIDGAGWVPPDDYDPALREWYKTAVEANGDVVIVTPYVDAQTGSIVITIAKSISNGDDVVCLDVIFNYIKDVAEGVEVAGKGQGMVIDSDGFIIAHHNEDFNGENVTEHYGQEMLNGALDVKSGRFSSRINEEGCTVFVSPVMNQWYVVILIDNSELFEGTYSQLAISIMLSLIILGFVSFFYYIGFKSERSSSKKLDRMNLQVVSALATAIDAKDTYTNGHSSRVAEYSRMIAERAGYSKTEQDEVYMMGLLHDVGKIGVPDEVINKRAKLSDEEFELIKKHPIIGSEILERIKERPKLATGARWHHERYGGGGYPDGISGEAIPEEARIIAVADAYDAMTSNRSYRDVMPQDKVRSEIENGIGTQFDPQFAEIMIKMIDEDTKYTMREK